MTELSQGATEFIEKLSLLAEADGLPRIAGRIMGLLIIRQEPVSFDELASVLQISRGSVSTNTRLLESRGVIRRVSRLGERKDLFEVPPDLPSRMLEEQMRRQRQLLEIAGEARKKLSSAESKARQALKNMQDFQSLALETTQKMLAAWRKQQK